MMEQDKVHGDEDGHVMMVIKLQIGKEEREKTKMGSRQRYIDRSHFWFALDTIEGVSDLGSIAVL